MVYNRVATVALLLWKRLLQHEVRFDMSIRAFSREPIGSESASHRREGSFFDLASPVRAISVSHESTSSSSAFGTRSVEDLVAIIKNGTPGGNSSGQRPVKTLRSYLGSPT
jgi:hypothetical protein